MMRFLPILVCIISVQSFTVRHSSIRYESSLNAFEIPKDLTKTCAVEVGSSSTHRCGLIATKAISKGDTILSIPYDTCELSTSSKVFEKYLPEQFDSWTGNLGLIALQILNEFAQAAGTGIPTHPKYRSFMNSWVQALPTLADMEYHPILWSEEDQEVLQLSTTNKIYRVLDDIEEDAAWLIENIFESNRDIFPETIQLNGATLPCFNLAGFRYAMALANSRTFFLQGQLRLLPIFDFCNHQDSANEISDASLGAFGSTKGARIVAHTDYQVGDEIFANYGPKSAADYVLEHGFCPASAWKTAVSELTFEMDPEDRFYDDKLDVLEFETYGGAMDPTQTFDVVSAPGRDGEPDPAMVQFLRLAKLGSKDAFLLESIFRKEVWGFMEYPVSEQNELEVVTSIAEACQAALDEFAECPSGGPEVCDRLRESESKALTRTLEFLQRDKEALDLKEYYQERRLKDLGLDSVWTPEDDILDPDLSYGQTRAPGGADYDW